MNIRTRYAPSPTGYLHVGGLRTALYNYLFARQNGGSVILRIEDTDQTRRVDGAVENLLSVFHWLSLEFDEGPHRGGAFGPYVQSERLGLYHDHVKQLAAKEYAYPCFCSSETLEQMRSQQAARSMVPMYDRRCLRLSREEAERRIAAGEPHVWRMAVPAHREVVIHDAIRGEVKFGTDTVDDQVLIKSDGFPTYHLANVVDDHLMRISHVIRGEEWLPSTPKHILLYEFFGWEPPVFAHLPLLLNPDRSKMSKRSGDVAVEDYRKKGILPEVLINFVALLGWHPGDDREMFTLLELVREFSLDRVNKAGAIFDQTKLHWLNTEYVKAESDDVLFEHVRGAVGDLIKTNGEARVRYAVSSLRGGAGSYEDLATRIHDVYAPLPEADPEMSALLQESATTDFIADFSARMSSIPAEDFLHFEKLEGLFKQAATEAGQAHGMKGKNLWRSLRSALTGQPHGPELAKLVGIWGRDRVLAELQRSLAEARSAAAR
ncbi:glutamate--tRNA ligase [candidate division KSB1 bacterium]|nr:MAG: glutamate--tRNA ligase [candidate division KSB1 bacterium]